MKTFDLATEPKTFVLVDPTAPNGESALSQLDHTDNHIAIVVGLAGPSAQALRDYAAAEEIDIATAASIYLDQVADRIGANDRLIEVVTVTSLNLTAEIDHLTAMSATRRVLFPDDATGTANPVRRWNTNPFRKRSLPATVRQGQLAEQLPKAELRQLHQIATIRDIPCGQTIISESIDERDCFVIIDGQFTVSSPTINAPIGPGNVVGELATLTGQRRSASVTASSSATVYELPPAGFESLLERAPEFRSLVLSTANDRLGNRNNLLLTKYLDKNEPSWSQRLAQAPRWKPID